METLDADVAIVGAGPAGVTLANLLGGYGVSVVVLEREAAIVDHPRAVGIDDEAIRTLQSFGMAEEILDEAIQNAPIRYYDSRGRILAHVAPSARPYGWPRRNLFYQPFLEQRLRTNLSRFDNVELLLGAEVAALRQDDTGVRLEARVGGADARVRARYVVGADGGRSFVRNAVGIDLLGDTAPSKWLVVDVERDTWDAPYSAVYSSPERPSMTIPLPFGFRRFEFEILDGEDPDRVSAPETVAALMKRFYPNTSVPDIVRSRVYLHHSRTASRFQSGSVFLVGDAAHLQPPFFGQGMNSGIRDVTNLAWKLGEVLTGRADPRILRTYDAERRDTARTMVSFATKVGRMYHPANRVTERIRNTVFRAAQKVPGGRDYILQMKYKPVPRYADGIVVGGRAADRKSLVGRAFPQPMVRTPEGDRVRLDDVLGTRLAVVGLVPEVAERVSRENAKRLAAQGGVIVQSQVNPTYRRAGHPDPAGRSRDGVVDVLDVYDIDGALRDLLLARPDDQVYVVRPDRYVAAICVASTVDSTLDEVLRLLES